MGPPIAVAGEFSDTWNWTTPLGSLGDTTKQWTFENVPAGKAVRLIRITGSWTSWPLGVIAAGSNVGTLLSFTCSSYGQSPFVGPGLGADNNCLFLQAAVAQKPVTVTFDVDVSAAGLLLNDNIMMVTLAFFLNTTTLQIQQQVSFTIEFGYE